MPDNDESQPPDAPTAPDFGSPSLPAAEDILGVTRNPDGRVDLRDRNVEQMLRDRGLPLRSLERCRFTRFTFGTRDRDALPAVLAELSFKDSLFENAWFVNMPLTAVYFRGSRFIDCDFRYAVVTRTSFQEAELRDCDFYRAYFAAANVFVDARLTRVSLDKAWLKGILGLTQDMFINRDPPALVQEFVRSSDYEEFLRPTLRDRPAQHSVEKALENAPLDLAHIYRSLSGLWTDQGQFNDASFAYVRSKDLEREYWSPPNVKRINRARAGRNDEIRQARSARDEGSATDAQLELADTPDEQPVRYGWGRLRSWLWLWIAGPAARYGESLSRVAIGVFFLSLLPGVGYSLFDGVESTAARHPIVGNVFQCWLFSFEQMTARSSARLQSSGGVVDLIGSIETLLGIAFLGLLGFVLANKLRSS